MPPPFRYPRLLLAGVLDIAALIWLAPHWRALGQGLRAPHAWIARDGADGALAQLTGAVLWCVALWLGAGLVALLLATAPGRVGSVSRGWATRVLPRSALRLLAGAAGLSVLLAPVSAGAQAVADNPVTSAASVAAPVWPTDGPGVTRISTTWPSTPTPTAPTGQPVTGVVVASSTTVVVRPGDSLWTIAARQLGPAASPEQIAAAWPRWYAANRGVIGPDASVLHAGVLLTAPAPAPQAVT